MSDRPKDGVCRETGCLRPHQHVGSHDTKHHHGDYAEFIRQQRLYRWQIIGSARA